MNHQALTVLLFLMGVCPVVFSDDAPLRVELDVTDVPHLASWGKHAKSLILRWQPRISALLAEEGVKSPRAIKLRIRKSSKGVGSTSGTTISISSHWIEKHPDDYGLVIHELVHVIQAYPPGGPWWITEGIADYLRWAIYEGKQPADFPRPDTPQRFRKGYQVAAGFLYWLEAGKAPGIVKKLNRAMRSRNYSDQIFRDETGLTLDELWNAYVSPR